MRDLWEARVGNVGENQKTLERELVQIGRDTDRFLDRIAEASTDSLITTYETRIKALEDKRRQTEAKIAAAGHNPLSFEESFRTAFAFLANPWKLWASGQLENRITTLRMVFSEPLTYCRKEGFRTAETAYVIKALGDISGQ